MLNKRLVFSVVALLSVFGCKMLKPGSSSAKDAASTQTYPSDDVRYIGLFEGSAASEAPMIRPPNPNEKIRIAGGAFYYWVELFDKFAEKRSEKQACGGSFPGNIEELRPYYAFYRRRLGPPPVANTPGSDPYGTQPTTLQTDPLGTIMNAYTFESCDAFAKTLGDAMVQWNSKRALSIPDLYTVYVVSKFKNYFAWSVAWQYLQQSKSNMPSSLPNDIYLSKTTPSYDYNLKAEEISRTTYTWDDLSMDEGSTYVQYFYGRIAKFHHNYPVVSGLIPIFGSVMAAGDSLMDLVEGRQVNGAATNYTYSGIMLCLNVATATLDAFTVKVAAVATYEKAVTVANNLKTKLKAFRTNAAAGKAITKAEIAELQSEIDASLREISSANGALKEGATTAETLAPYADLPFDSHLEISHGGVEVSLEHTTILEGSRQFEINRLSAAGGVVPEPGEIKAFNSLLYDPHSPQSAKFLQKAKALASGAPNEVAIADRLVDHVNRSVFPKDTPYDLATGTTDPDFFRVMTADSKTITSKMDELYAIQKADCRAHNLELAAEMRAAGVSDAKVVNAKVITGQVTENHTIVQYSAKINGQPTVMFADSYYRQFNGSLTELMNGKSGPTGRWLDPKGPVNDVAKIVIDQQSFPKISTIGVK